MVDVDERRVGLATIAREWGRIGCVGFGGPPAHIALLRDLCVTRRRWLSETDFEDGVAATNLLPGPASTQLAVYTAWRLRGAVGAIVGGVCFIVPGLVLILALAALFLANNPPLAVRGAAAGAGAAVAAVAVHAASGLVPGSWKRAGTDRTARFRWICYAVAGAVSAAVIGPWLVLVMIGTGLVEVAIRTGRTPTTTMTGTGAGTTRRAVPLPLPLPKSLLKLVPKPLLRLASPAVAVPATGGLLALSWVAFKVGALSYGGGFVIIPLMQHDAVHTYHWMTDAQFLNAVALGQITPGPVVQTVAVVGYAAAGVGGGLLAALVAFGPSFLFVIGGASHFDRLRTDRRVQAFLTGAGPTVVGAIAGSAIPLAAALQHLWQFAILAAAALWLLAARRGVVSALVASGVLGAGAALLGWPVG